MFTNESDNEDLRLAQGVAQAVAGAVSFPSPVPAVGLLLLGTISPTSSSKRYTEKETEYYLRIVQFVSPSLMVSRYVYAGTIETAGDIRLIQGLLVVDSEKDPEIFADKPQTLVGKDLATYLTLLKSIKNKAYGAEGEQVAARNAIIYVPEQATIQLRADLETIAVKCELPLTPCDPIPIPTCDSGGGGGQAGGGGHLLPW
jgi:hypothetical protein